MPKKLEEKLKKKAQKMFPNDKEKQNAYVYGTLRKTGWKPEGEERRHRRDLDYKPRRRRRNA